MLYSRGLDQAHPRHRRGRRRGHGPSIAGHVGRGSVRPAHGGRCAGGQGAPDTFWLVFRTLVAVPLQMGGLVSRLSSLLRRLEAQDSQLAADLKEETDALLSRRQFGLNFERHIPEAVDLPARFLRRGDKVRVLPERGSPSGPKNAELWKVRRIRRVKGRRGAEIVSRAGGYSTVDVDDLAVVAEFGDRIYPGLESLGTIERGGDKPFHTVINAENYHTLRTLLYTHTGKVDAIYIDPPYNSGGAKDWKYNNRYVDENDAYRHSKWLAMMERRLKLAKRLLNPTRSVLIVAIDEREVHRLALLLEQTYGDADIQMITTVISAKGVVRPGKFSRVEEHLFVVTLGPCAANPWMRNMLDPTKGDKGATTGLEWLGLRRREPTSVRGKRPNQFYPIFVDRNADRIHSIGDAIADDVDTRSVVPPEGTRAVWPLKPDGTEMIWGLRDNAARRNWKRGFVRVSRKGTVQYLQTGTIAEIENGTIHITRRSNDGSIRGTKPVDDEAPTPKRVWNMRSHNAESGGTKMLSKLIPGRRFTYPKSLYAVEDILRFVVGDKPNAVVLDFFAGSGTTLHAVMRLNELDGGRRQCILATNNEVSDEEEKQLRTEGLRPGDPDWEKHGIFESVTKPRIVAALTGKRPDGTMIEGDYEYTDEFPMADGFQENVEFFRLTYESPLPLAINRSYRAIDPLLWLKSGASGNRIGRPTDFAVGDAYAVLFDMDSARGFVEAVARTATLREVFIVTDDEALFQMLYRKLPGRVATTRLYESYVTNFEFSIGQE